MTISAMKEKLGNKKIYVQYCQLFYLNPCIEKCQRPEVKVLTVVEIRWEHFL